MRLAFWRAGKDEAVVERAVATPCACCLRASRMHRRAGDLDLHALGQALMRKRSWIIVPTVLAAGAVDCRGQHGLPALSSRKRAS